MVEGVSGLLAIHGRERPQWEPSRRRLQWANGATAQCFSAEDPESLRGPQFECAWLDELGKWRHDQECFDMLQFGLRLGEHPRQVITTTPRPTLSLKRLLVDPRSAVTRSKTIDNSAHLAPDFFRSVVARYAGTRLGRRSVRSGPCAGVAGGLANPVPRYDLVAGASGIASTTFQATAPMCGALAIQALDVGSCQTTSVRYVPDPVVP
jgi:phage terminase large subunit-like protein